MYAKIKSGNKQNIYCYIVILLCGFLLCFRAFYSFTWSDESFYLTVVHRLWLGESMLSDEWYTTQLSAPVLLPFYSIYQWITGGNDGVYLYFRLLYIAISVLTAVYSYRSLSKSNRKGLSLFCVLIYLFYSRANIGGMSYYNLTLTCVMLSTVLLLENIQKKSRVKLIIIGVLLAIAVVNTPFLAVPYLLILLFVIVFKTKPYKLGALLIFLGTALTAAVYMGYLLSTISIQEIILNIPHILNEPEIQKTNPLLVLPLMLARVLRRFKWTVAGTTLLAVLYFLEDRNKICLKPVVSKVLVALNVVIVIINSALSADLIGCINIAGCLFFFPYLMAKQKRSTYMKNQFLAFAVAGFSISLAFSFSSDTGLDAMTIGFVLIVIGMILDQAGQKKIESGKKEIVTEANRVVCSYAVWLLVISLVLFQTVILRLVSVYRDAPLNELTVQLEEGPGKYLYTTPEHAEQYQNTIEAIRTCVRDDDRVLYSKSCYWSYLCTDNAYGTPSSWRMSMDSPRLQEYYTLYPDKVPTCVFVFGAEYGNYESSMIQNNEFVPEPNENAASGYLYDYMEVQGYEEINEECGTVYRSR